MKRLSSWISRRTVCWIQLGVSFFLSLWAVAVYPLAFEIALRFERAHADSDSEVGVFFWGMEKLFASGWFTISLALAFSLAFFSMVWVREDRRIVFAQRVAMFIPITLVALHAIVDGPRNVAMSAFAAVLMPTTFFDPIDLCLRLLASRG